MPRSRHGRPVDPACHDEGSGCKAPATRCFIHPTLNPFHGCDTHAPTGEAWVLLAPDLAVCIEWPSAHARRPPTGTIRRVTIFAGVMGPDGTEAFLDLPGRRTRVPARASWLRPVPPDVTLDQFMGAALAVSKRDLLCPTIVGLGAIADVLGVPLVSLAPLIVRWSDTGDVHLLATLPRMADSIGVRYIMKHGVAFSGLALPHIDRPAEGGITP